MHPLPIFLRVTLATSLVREDKVIGSYKLGIKPENVKIVNVDDVFFSERRHPVGRSADFQSACF